METEKKETTPVANTKRPQNNDLRTFVIALLTALIVVMLYHLGMGICKTFCGGNNYSCGMRPCTYQQYMQIPLMGVPCGTPCGMKTRGCGPFRSKCMATAPEQKPEPAVTKAVPAPQK